MFEVLQHLFATNVGAGDGWVIEGFPTARSHVNKKSPDNINLKKD